MEAACEEAMKNPAVTGVVCVDKQGLCMHSSGAVPEGTSGSVAELALHAEKLVGEGAVISLCSAQSKVVLSRSEGFVTALFMQPDQ